MVAVAITVSAVFVAAFFILVSSHLYTFSLGKSGGRAIIIFSESSRQSQQRVVTNMVSWTAPTHKPPLQEYGRHSV